MGRPPCQPERVARGGERGQPARGRAAAVGQGRRWPAEPPPRRDPAALPAAHRVDDVAERPHEGLDGKGDERLDGDRIRDQPEERAEVRQRVQPPGRDARPRLAEPGLHERTRRRQNQVRQADRGREHRQQPEHGVRRADRLPARRRQDRGPPEQQAARHHHDRNREHRRVRPALIGRRAPADRACARATRRAPWKNSRRRPDGRRAPNQGRDFEEAAGCRIEKRAEEDRRAERIERATGRSSVRHAAGLL